MAPITRIIRSAGILLGYAAAVVWMTWPLGASVATHLPNTAFSCPFDPLLLAWALAHQSRVVLSAPTQLLHGNIFHPDPNTLLYGETGFGVLPYFMPTFLLTANPTLALNLTFLGSIALTAWALHLVAARWAGSFGAGVVAAGTFLLTRWVLWSHAPCVPSYAVLQYFPLIIFLSATDVDSPRRAALLALLLVLQGLSNAYLAVAALLPLTLLTLLRLMRPAARAAAMRSLTAVVLAAVVLFLAYSGHVLLRRANPDLMMQTWWGMRLEENLPFGPFSYMTPLGMPLVFALLVILGALRTRAQRMGRRRPWAVLWFWAIVGFLISLSPVVWWREVKLTVPHLALPLWLGVYDVIRIPDRLGVAALLACCLITGLAFADLTAWLANAVGGRGRRTHRLVRLAVAILVLAVAYREYRRGADAGPLAMIRSQGFKVRFPGNPQPFSPPPQYFWVRPLPSVYPLQPAASLSGSMLTALAADRGPVLEVPVGPGAGGSPALQARAEYRSIFHGRPLVNGYSGYYPPGFPQRMGLARQLPDPAALATLRRETSVAAILVHSAELSDDERGRWLAAQAGRDDLSLVLHDGSDLLFAISPIAIAP